jgi:hypothetical protein
VIRDRKALERNVLGVFERAGRTFAPTTDPWHRSGDLLSDIARKDGAGDQPRVEVVRE